MIRRRITRRRGAGRLEFPGAGRRLLLLLLLLLLLTTVPVCHRGGGHGSVADYWRDRRDEGRVARADERLS